MGALTKPLQIISLSRGARCGVAIALLAGCGGRQHVETPAPTQPLPTAGLAAQQVSVLPLTLLAAEDSLHWQAKFADRRAALAQADSVIGTLLTARAPEVTIGMVDGRTGRLGVRTTARGDGDDPWSALTGAVKSLTPGLP